MSLVALLILIDLVIEDAGLGTWIIRPVIPEAFFILVMLYLDAIDKKSMERGRLINDLESTRARLASSERQAGVLQERERLGREIHDTLAQGFTGIVMHHEAAETALPEIPARPRVNTSIRPVRRRERASPRQGDWCGLSPPRN